MNAMPSDTASRWVWLIALLAMNQPYPRKAPQIGDIVVETTHIAWLARHRLGLHKAVGELLEIDKTGGAYAGQWRYLIKSIDPLCGETWWDNAAVEVIERMSYSHDKAS